MGEVKRKTPRGMPDNASVERLAESFRVPLLIAGSRGDKATHNPDYAIHGNYRVRGGDLSIFRGKHVLIFVHGYNVNVREALASTKGFFSKCEAALERDGRDLAPFGFLSFTWPGDVGPAHFNDAQAFAHHSGVGLYRLVNDLVNVHGIEKVTLLTHSLGAHVGLRCASVLGERLYHGRGRVRFAKALLLAAAVEDDVFRRPTFLEEFHFPDAAFAIEDLHVFMSRADDVLKHAFRVSEWDAALGYSGPETMQPLKSLARRVEQLSNGKLHFTFQLHDFSPSSPTVMNPDVWATGHGDYWDREAQADYYVNYI